MYRRDLFISQTRIQSGHVIARMCEILFENKISVSFIVTLGLPLLAILLLLQRRGTPSRPTSTRGTPPCASSWGWTSSRGTWCGSRGRTLPVSIPTLKFSTRFCGTSSSRASGSRPTRGTAATRTKSNARATMRIRRRIGRCRGG